MEAPDYEVRVAEKLQDFRQRLKEIRGLPEGSQEAAIDALQAEMLALKTKFAKYAVVPPVRKDESEHKVKRVRNLLNQMRGLIAQSEVLETQMAKDIPQFNRNIPKDPPWTQQVRDQLDQLDRSRWKRAKIVGGVTTGLGIIGGACYFYLSSGGGF